MSHLNYEEELEKTQKRLQELEKEQAVNEAEIKNLSKELGIEPSLEKINSRIEVLNKKSDVLIKQLEILNKKLENEFGE